MGNPTVEIRSHQGTVHDLEDQPTTLDRYLRHFQRRVLQDALLEGTSTYWLRRANTFAAVGNPDCDEIATACYNHADLLTRTDLDVDCEGAITIVLNHLGDEEPWE